MRTSGQVAQKLKQVRFRHLKKEMSRLLKVSCWNCKNISPVTVQGGGKLGVCKLDFKTCDPSVQDRSESCGVFEPIHTPEEIKESLQEFFHTRQVHEIAVRYPDVAALLWVLLDGEEGSPQEGPLLTGVQVGTFFGTEIWTDTPEEAFNLTREISVLLEKARIPGEIAGLLGCDSDLGSLSFSIQTVKSALENSFHTQQDLSKSRIENELLKKEVTDLRKEWADLEVKVKSIETSLSAKAPTATPWWRFW